MTSRLVTTLEEGTFLEDVLIAVGVERVTLAKKRPTHSTHSQNDACVYHVDHGLLRAFLHARHTDLLAYCGYVFPLASLGVLPSVTGA